MRLTDRRWAAVAGFLACGLAEPAFAQHAHDDDREAGGVYYDLDLELQNDRTARATDGNRRDNLKAEVEAGLRYQATGALSFNLGLKMEQLEDAELGRDGAFENHGLFVESLTANYDIGAVSLYVGKFTPNFGIAWDVAPGIYTKEFAEEDYELSEKWGFGGSVGLPGGALGHLDLSASAFFADRTALSDSLFYRRGRTTGASGGPSNTGDLASFALALDGHEVPGFDSLEYQIAFVRQGRGEGDAADETGVVGSVSFTVPVAGPVSLSPMLEYAVFQNRDGVRGRDQQNLTAAGRFDYEAWNVILGYGRRHLSESGGDDTTDELFQLTLGYAFENGLRLDGGYGRFDDDGVLSDVFGFKLSYELAGRLY